MSDLVTLELEEVRGVPVARVAGEVDVSNANPIQAWLLEAVGNEGVGLVVDLTRTTYIDSAGVRLLFDVGSRLHMRGMGLRLVAVSDSFVADVLATVRIGERFPIDGAPAAAAAALSERLPAGRPAE